MLAFPKYDWGWLAWIGLVPLLISLVGKTAVYGFFSALLFGLTFFAGVFYWTLSVDAYSLLHQLVLIIFLGSYFGLFGLAFAGLIRKYSLTAALIFAPFIWVSLEYLRSNMGFLAHPWPLLGHTQDKYLLLIQIADLAGAYGVSFLVVMVNSALTAGVWFLFYGASRRLLPRGVHISNRGVWLLAATAICLAGGSLLYGTMMLSKPIEGQKLKISLVQGNIPQAKKWQPKFAKTILEIYTDLTHEVMREAPALIVWPEAATPRPVCIDKSLYHLVRKLAGEAGSYLLLGSSSHEKFRQQEDMKIKFKNSAFLFSPDVKEPVQQYDKIHLLPFGEYIPHQNSIPWHWIHIPKVATTLAGNTFTVFQGSNFRFSSPICWETVFPYMIRNFVRNGAQFIVNITNEAWFGDTAAPYHFLSSNVFRAVENRKFVVRCGNTGVSCFIDPHGNTVDRVTDTSGRDIFVRGTLTETIRLNNVQTLYVRFGDWFAFMCIGCSMLFMIIGIFREKKALNFR